MQDRTDVIRGSHRVEVNAAELVEVEEKVWMRRRDQ